jgi:hypothetical protein
LKTRTELINQVLMNLGVLAVGQAADADTFDVVDNLVDGLLAELEAQDIIYIQDITTYGVEEKHFQPLARMLAWRAAPAFGAQNDQGLMLLAVQASEQLNNMDRREVHWNGKHWRTMQTDYPVNIITSSTSLGNI